MDAPAPTKNAEPTAENAVRHTVVGLFEDTIDGEQAIGALRKADYSPERISVLVRDQTAEPGNTDHGGAVARAVVANALDAVSGWLQGLAALIVPERGTYLVAGPIGAALAGWSSGGPHAPTDAGGAGSPGADPTFIAAAASTAGLSSDGLLRTLEDFGFSPDEATYLENRLAAGSVLVALTTANADRFHEARRLFSDHNAVYIGLSQTDATVLADAEALLAASPEASSGGVVVVADAVAPFVRSCHDDAAPAALAALCGRVVHDVGGADAGSVEDVLADPTAPGASAVAPAIRYLVIGFGGVLGLGRHHVPVPAELIDTAPVPLRLRVTKDVLHRAPAYSDPFSRGEEQAICHHFGIACYWVDPAASHAPPAPGGPSAAAPTT